MSDAQQWQPAPDVHNERALRWELGGVSLIVASYMFGQYRIKVWLGDYEHAIGAYLDPQC